MKYWLKKIWFVLKSKVSFKVDPRLDYWKTGGLIILGTEIQLHAPMPYCLQYYLLYIDFTILNFGFKFLLFPSTNENVFEQWTKEESEYIKWKNKINAAYNMIKPIDKSGNEVLDNITVRELITGIEDIHNE